MSHAAGAPPEAAAPVFYPDSDGEPLADNTEQFAFIDLVHSNLDAIRDDFVAANHLWYPVRGRPDIRVAPDVYVAVGRPKGPRGCYRQWEEEDTPLTVVFEWWSTDSTFAKEVATLRFYDQHGVQEFYSWDQLSCSFAAFVRQDGELRPVGTDDSRVSPRLGIRFEVKDRALLLFRPDGTPFRTLREMEAERDAATAERDAATAERDRAMAERDAATLRATVLAERLRALGIDPDVV